MPSDLARAIESIEDWIYLGLDAAIQRWHRMHVSYTQNIEEADEMAERLREHFQNNVLQGRGILREHSIFQSSEDWYFGPRESDTHWPKLKRYLEVSKKRGSEAVAEIDRDSTDIVSLLGNPRKDKFSNRGLVVGYVQSGKTENMTAVIAKAVDAGYNFVFLLSGVTNKLRLQTQERLVIDLFERSPYKWRVETGNSEDGDFQRQQFGGFAPEEERAHLYVIKKERTVLSNVFATLSDTLPRDLSRMKVLLIDDECDHASPNGSARARNMSAINELIRTIIRTLPCISYVGYSATPFANILINPEGSNTGARRRGSLELDDLYPKDFIVALRKNPNYFGTEELFGRDPSSADDVSVDEEGLDMIREVLPSEELLMRPERPREKDSFHPQMTDSLRVAILYYLATCAARRVRGQEQQHMTMLIHTSPFMVQHERVSRLVESFISDIAPKIKAKNSEIVAQMKAIWEYEAQRVPDSITTAKRVSFDELSSRMVEVLEALEIVVENGESEDRINYSLKPRTYIVVGGAILARGLTLEGLCVSYFLRQSNQYDTLLQMGRWFGYRLNYEDYPRIWMPLQLAADFRSLARVEAEIRSDIDQYAITRRTPMDIAVRIRRIPGLAITAASKMRAATTASVSYWGTHQQTRIFEQNNSDELKNNWKVASRLIDEVESMGLRDASSRVMLWRGVPKSHIISFFSGYSVNKAHTELRSDLLVRFITNDNDRLNQWNVAMITKEGGENSQEPVGAAGIVSMISRAKLGNTDPADIKQLMSKRDIMVDCKSANFSDDMSWDDVKRSRLGDVGEIPMLLLYPIDRVSEPKSTKVRTALNAVFDVMGYAFIFPGEKGEGSSFVSVDLDQGTNDEIEQIELEESQQLSESSEHGNFQ